VWKGRLGGCCFVGCDSEPGFGSGNGDVKRNRRERRVGSSNVDWQKCVRTAALNIGREIGREAGESQCV